MIISRKIQKLIANQEGWTRRMFEEGLRIKREYGEQNVYDFSLGNPDTEPPEQVQKTLVETLAHPLKGMHRYMSNNGYEDVRSEIAAYLSEQHGVPFTATHIFMSTGCAGGLNILLKSILSPGDQVIVPSPFFWEFKNYIENHGGLMRLVQSKKDFQLDMEKLEKAINVKTKAILINSPNNPTGAVYTEETLKALAELLNRRRAQGQEIYIISDDAYKKIVYDGIRLPNLFQLYDLVFAVTSHSKDLALPGERIGYVAISPRIPEYELVVSALMISMRTLGFVNAPALFQRIAGMFQRTSVNIGEYEKKRDTLYEILMEGGFECVKPLGAFYMFPKSPIADEVEFVRMLQQEERIMVVPGRGFGKKGYFRIAYCVPIETIQKSAEGFIRTGKRYNLR
ncbi:MAG TPA: pyridoxal phosphate-dependent aminotransferase [Syntrophorhabdaceae bacterium]|nr:pyridoxal phosphate-dependent aminotransferase [Syntrophorhabdaceae bacterium]